jgi:hypothetical protein
MMLSASVQHTVFHTPELAVKAALPIAVLCHNFNVLTNLLDDVYLCAAQGTTSRVPMQHVD